MSTPKLSKDSLDHLSKEIVNRSPVEIVAYAHHTFGQGLGLASSLGAEDQVLTHMLLSSTQNARVIVLDTGRLHPQTYEVMATTQAKYRFRHEVYFPDATQVETMVKTKGINLFYDSIDDRKYCCHVRKVEPLTRALSTCTAWMTGLRKSQSVTRSDIPLIEWDDTHHIFKLNPLANMSEEDVWAYIQKNDIPYNRLHDEGYPSIGCAPCTRPIQEGEDIRAGRWWWESKDQKECGLHIKDGKIIRPQGASSAS